MFSTQRSITYVRRSHVEQQIKGSLYQRSTTVSAAPCLSGRSDHLLAACVPSPSFLASIECSMSYGADLRYECASPTTEKSRRRRCCGAIGAEPPCSNRSISIPCSIGSHACWHTRIERCIVRPRSCVYFSKTCCRTRAKVTIKSDGSTEHENMGLVASFGYGAGDGRHAAGRRAGGVRPG